MRRRCAAAITLALLAHGEWAVAQPTMVPFGFSREGAEGDRMMAPVSPSIAPPTIALAPPAAEDPLAPDRLLTPQEMSDAMTAASRIERRELILTEDEIENILAMFIEGATNSVVSTVTSLPLGGGGLVGAIKSGNAARLARERATNTGTSTLLGGSAGELAARYFRLEWRSRGEHERLARLMAEAGVHPGRIDVDPNASSHGARGYMDIWVETLKITNQQHLLAQVRKKGSSLPDVWLLSEIQKAEAARREVYAAADVPLLDHPTLTDAQREGRDGIEAFRQRMEESQ